MKTRLIVILATLALTSGCTTVELGDAKVTSLFNKRSFKKLILYTTSTNEVVNKLTVEGYQSDQVEGAAALAEGIAAGVSKGIKP